VRSFRRWVIFWVLVSRYGWITYSPYPPLYRYIYEVHRTVSWFRSQNIQKILRCLLKRVSSYTCSDCCHEQGKWQTHIQVCVTCRLSAAQGTDGWSLVYMIESQDPYYYSSWASAICHYLMSRLRGHFYRLLGKLIPPATLAKCSGMVRVKLWLSL
jgi:hypothetical protein